MSLTLQKRRMQGHRTEKFEGSGLDMSASKAFGSMWLSCSFVDCDFSGSDFQQSDWYDCTFKNCTFRYANFRAAKLRHVRFEECDTRDCAFVGVTPMEQAVFLSCQLQYASFFDSTVRFLSLLDSNLHGTDLRFTEASGVLYHGSNLWSSNVVLGCTFLNAEFDERQCDLFTGMVARKHPLEEKRKLLTELAGISAKVVDRLMSDRSA